MKYLEGALIMILVLAFMNRLGFGCSCPISGAVSSVGTVPPISPYRDLPVDLSLLIEG